MHWLNGFKPMKLQILIKNQCVVRLLFSYFYGVRSEYLLDSHRNYFLLLIINFDRARTHATLVVGEDAAVFWFL